MRVISLVFAATGTATRLGHMCHQVWTTIYLSDLPRQIVVLVDEVNLLVECFLGSEAEEFVRRKLLKKVRLRRVCTALAILDTLQMHRVAILTPAQNNDTLLGNRLESD